MMPLLSKGLICRLSVCRVPVTLHTIGHVLQNGPLALRRVGMLIPWCRLGMRTSLSLEVIGESRRNLLKRIAPRDYWPAFASRVSAVQGSEWGVSRVTRRR